jgi:PKD repeat protein
LKNILTIQVEEQDNIGRLFREKLEFAELIPSASLRNELMSKTARKEFLRFNPTRVNIYYLAALLAVAAAALILITGNNRHEEQAPKPSQTDTNKISVVPVVPAIADQVISQGQLKVNLSDSLAAANSEVSRNDSSSPANGTSTADQRALNITPVREMATVKGIFTGQGGDGKELKGMITVPGLIEAQVTEGCAPLKIKFGCSNGSYESYQWSFGNGGNSDLKQPEWTFTAEGDYRIALVVRRTD